MAVQTIPLPVIFRLPKYYNLLKLKKQFDEKWISSQQIAQSLDLTSSTVRKDLLYVNFTGTRSKGYDIDELSCALYAILSNAGDIRVAIVGAGNLGRAIAKHREFALQGFTVCAFFDTDPLLQGDTISGIRIHSVDKINDLVTRLNIHLGIIAVPADAAQVSVDRLIAAGVPGILNLTTTHLKVPETISVVDFSLMSGLLQLSCSINMRRQPAMQCLEPIN